MQWLGRSVAALILALLAGVLPLAAEDVSGEDAREFQRIIAAQIEAFRADDGPAAYSHAAPAIKRIFPSPDVFMDMVRNGYHPVYRPRSFAFGAVTEETSGRPIQRVTIVDDRGKTWTALYAFERQKDGSWKIIGCTLVESEGGEA